MRQLPNFLLFQAAAAAALAWPVQAETLYVSLDGRAGWSGKLAAPNRQQTDGPLPSLEGARDAVRTLLAKDGAGPITVLIRKGEYELSEPLTFTPEDSGTPRRPVVWAAYPGEVPSLCGGRKIAGWSQGKAAWTAEIPDVRDGKWYFRQLFVNGARAQRARSPNYGYYRIDGPSSTDRPFKLKYRGTDIRKEWAGQGVEVVALLAWADLRMQIASVDEETHVATLTGNPQRSNRENDGKYYIENAPDALDAGGEWYLDRQTGRLSYKPVGGEDLGKAVVIAPVLRKLIRLEGKPEAGQFIRNLTFRGLHFCHTDWELAAEGYADTQSAFRIGAVFEATGAENCSIEGCTFAHLGDYAIWFGRGSKRNRIVANEIFDMGAGGIKIGEASQRQNPDEQNVGTVITDNHLHNLGNVYAPAHGIWIGQASDNTVSHNHIHDLFYSAISAGWTWGYGPNQSKNNRIEYNHLHHMGQNVLSDMGAIYTLGTQPGTVIRNNLIHDVEGFTYGGWGIYPDEGSSDMLIENNVVYLCKQAGFHQHYGRENKLRNNIFAFNKEYQLMRTRAEEHVSFMFENNIVYFDQGRLLGSNWTGTGYKMDKNVYWDVRGTDIRFAGMTFSDWKEKGHDINSLIADPMFVDAENYNFNLRPGSPALKLGFKPIDLSTVGPRVTPGVPPKPAAAKPAAGAPKQ